MPYVKMRVKLRWKAHLFASGLHRAVVQTWKPLGPHNPALQAPHALAKPARVQMREARPVCGRGRKGGRVEAGQTGRLGRGVGGCTFPVLAVGTLREGQWAGRASRGHRAWELPSAPSFGLALVETTQAEEKRVLLRWLPEGPWCTSAP